MGIIPAFMEAEGLTPEVKAAVQRAAQELQNQGCRAGRGRPAALDAAIAAYYVIGPAEAFSNLARFDGIRYGYQEEGCANLSDQSSLSRAHGFGAEAKRRQMLGAYLLSSGVTTSTTTLRKRPARSSRRTTAPRMPRWTPSSCLPRRARPLSLARSATPRRCTSPTCTPSRSTFAATAVSRCRWAWARTATARFCPAGWSGL